MISLLILHQIEWSEKSNVVNTKFLSPKGYGPKAAIPPELRIQPRDYQLQGLYWLSSPTPTGKILADDMGLGKTLQALATAAALPNRENGARQVLVIVPRQVLRNWYNEFVKVFNPGDHEHSMSVIIVHGTEGFKPAIVTVGQLRGYDIVLTTSDTICAQIRAYKTALAETSRGASAMVPKNGFGLVGVAPPKVKSKKNSVLVEELEPVTSWQMILLDEAHFTRSKAGTIVKNLMVLKADRKLALTGTPISNTPEDLFNILLFLEDEASKDRKEFVEKVVQPIIARPHMGQIGGFEKDFGPLHSIFRRVLLRRDKGMVIGGVPIVSLKGKTINKHLAKLSDLEENVYEAVYQMGKTEYERFSNQDKAISVATFVQILENFLRLRQTCCDVGLLLDASRAKDLQQQTQADNEDEDFDNPQERPDVQYTISPAVRSLCESAENSHLIPAKSRVMLKILEKTYMDDPQAKVLIFTEWTKHLERIIKQLSAHGYNFIEFHGGLSAEQRDSAQLGYYQRGVHGMVLTVGAGGQGLNLVQANVVILLTPPWNPQRDAQAMDRVYRIGQTKDVQVHHVFALSMQYRPGHDWKTLPTIEDLIQQKQFMKLDFIAGSYGQEHTENSQGGISADPGREDAENIYGSDRQLLPRDPTELHMKALSSMQAAHQDASSNKSADESSSDYKPYINDNWLVDD